MGIKRGKASHADLREAREHSLCTAVWWDRKDKLARVDLGGHYLLRLPKGTLHTGWDLSALGLAHNLFDVGSGVRGGRMEPLLPLSRCTHTGGS